MIKVYLNTCIAVICWWLVNLKLIFKVGYGICMGSGKFAGTDFYAGSNFAGTKHYSHWGTNLHIIYKSCKHQLEQLLIVLYLEEQSKECQLLAIAF